MTTYTWRIEAVDAIADGFVIAAHWRATATDGPHDAELSGVANFTDKSGEPFKPFAQLIEQEIISWAQGQMGEDMVASIVDDLAAQIEARANPPSVSVSLPWEA